MRHIDNWENIQESTPFQRLAPGGYICAIKNVKDVPDKEYLELEFDIVKGDDKGYFTKQYQNDTRNPKSWPNSGIIRRSYKDSAASMFKGFTNAIEKSNKGFHWNWDEQALKNKYFGAVIGDEEYINSKGQKRIRNNVVAVRSVETIESGDFKIPELKTVDNNRVIASGGSGGNSVPAGFVDPFANMNQPDTETSKQDAPDPTPANESPFGGEDDPFANL